MEWHLERGRLLLVRHRRLDRLRRGRDLDSVPRAQELVERPLEIPRLDTRYDARRDMERLDGHRDAVRQAKPLDDDDLVSWRDIEETTETRPCELASERERRAARCHATPAHVLAERGHRELLGDLRLLDVGPAAPPAHEVALAREVVERGADGQARDAEVRAELPLGGDRGADAETLDQLEHLLPRRALLGHLRGGSDRLHRAGDYRGSRRSGQCHCFLSTDAV